MTNWDKCLSFIKYGVVKKNIVLNILWVASNATIEEHSLYTKLKGNLK